MNRDAYQTPPAVFAALNAEFNFKVDVAASRKNALCDIHISEEENALIRDWTPDNSGWAGCYVWCNPPYSDIGPWVKKAAEQAAKGIGTVMLVMMDQSVGWFKDAVQTCQEVRLVIGGRLSFIDPTTGKPAAGNNKGSMFLIWHPFGRMPAVFSCIEREDLLGRGTAALLDSPTETPAAAPELPVANDTWPIEVTELVEAALDQCPCEPTDTFYAQLCAQANAQRLSGKTNEEAIQAVVATLKEVAADYLQGDAA